MAQYTTKLKTICEYYAGSDIDLQYGSVGDVIERSLPYVFDFDFPIWDESYRTTLETKIIKHFYLYEIGQETPALFKLALDVKLNEIMPYYNKLYETTVLDFNPLYNVDYTITLDRTQEGNSADNDTTSSDRNVTGQRGLERTEDKSGQTGVIATDTRTDDLTAATNNTTQINESYTEDSTIKDTGSKTGTNLRTDNLSRDTVGVVNTDSRTLGDINIVDKHDITVTDTTVTDTDKTGTADTTETTTDKVTSQGTDTISSTTTENGSDSSSEKYSDTPQGSVAGMGPTYDSSGNLVSSDMWLTNATLKNGTHRNTNQLNSTENTTNTTQDNKTVTTDTDTTENVDTTVTQNRTEKDYKDYTENTDTTVNSKDTTTGTINDTGTQKHETDETSTNTRTEDMDKSHKATNTVTGSEKHTGTQTMAKASTTTDKQDAVINITESTGRNDKQNILKSKKGNFDTTENYIKHIVGKTNNYNYGKLIEELRHSLLNIDMMIINELSECFMLVW